MRFMHMHPRKVKGVRKKESNQKRFYNRETIATLNYEIQPKPFILLFSSATKNNPFLNSRISANHDKVNGLSDNDGEIPIK